MHKATPYFNSRFIRPLLATASPAYLSLLPSEFRLYYLPSSGLSQLSFENLIICDSPLSISPYCLYRRTQPLILPGDILSGFKCIPLPANTTIINYGHVTVQFLFAITSIGIRTACNIIQFITDR